MTRILFRSGKDPFTPVVAESTLTQDVFNSNSGNFLFQHAIWRALLTPGTTITSNGTLSEREAPAAGDADRINEQFDAFVVPLANAFRPDFMRRLENLTALIRDLTVPVTVVGVGAQAGLSMDTTELAEVDAGTKAFVGAVLDRSASIGVRGEFTRDYLVGLGFPENSIDIIGCPSLFLHGDELTVGKRAAAIGVDSPLALNLTPAVPGIGAFASDQADRHPNLTYIGQDADDLRLLLWGVPFPQISDPLVPTHMRHRLYREDRFRLFLDTWPWYDFLAGQDFAYGTRFHGNVAALLAGTPAMLLAHDSRTLELADYHAIPHRSVAAFTAPLRAEDLYDEADFAAFNAATPDRFGRFTAFLERNGLRHIWQPGMANPEFADRLALARFPPAVTTLVNADGSELAARLRWLHDGMTFDGLRHPQAYKHPFPYPPRRDAGTRVRNFEAVTKAKLSAQRQELTALDKRIRKLENRTVIGFLRGVGRVARRKLRPTPAELPPGPSGR